MTSNDARWVPVDACTLPTEEQPLRLAEFDALLATSGAGTDRRGPTWLRLRLVGSEQVHERARDLTARETACCSFFRFAVHRVGANVVIDIRVPPDRADVLDGLERVARRLDVEPGR